MRHLPLVLGILLGHLALPAPTDASTADAYKGWRVASLNIEGLDSELSDPLREGLQLAGQNELFGRDYPVFYPNLLDQDVIRCRLYLARNGYPRARVDARVRAASGKDQRVDVTLQVVPGPAVRVHEVLLTGEPVELTRSLRDLLPKAHRRFVDDEMASARRHIRAELLDAGYAKAEVTAEVEALADTAVTVTFAVQPGAVYYFRNVVIEGAPDDLEPVARRTINIGSGEKYSAETIKDAEESLRLLNLFRQIRLSVDEAGADSLDLHTQLAPRDHRTIKGGVGYWTDDRLKVQASWSHQNLFARGRGFEVGGTLSQFLRRGGLGVWWPNLVGSRTRTFVNLDLIGQFEDTYDQRSLQLETGIIYRRSFGTAYRASIAFSSEDVDPKTDDPEASFPDGGLLTVLNLGATLNRTDDQLDPTRGSYNWVTLYFTAPDPFSENRFFSIEGQTAHYRQLTGGIVGAFRVNAGYAIPIQGSDDLLPDRRFFAGGASSNRGFQRRRLGPLDSDGEAIGGETKLEISGETRIQLVGVFRGALFADLGQVYRRAGEFRFDELKLSVGPALMITTPVGPVRADLGYRVSAVDADLPRWVFHFAIGHPF